MGNDWNVALEQRADLTTARGSREAVAESVRRGADLRLYMTTELYEETLYFQQTYAGLGDEFAGLMSHHHSYDHRGDNAKQPYLSLFKYDSFGTYSHIKWMLGDETIDEGKTYPYGVYRWFVCDRWSVVYEHDAEGRPTRGSLDELAEHARLGRSIRVGVKNLFGIQGGLDDGPEHISFLTTMQPMIQGGQVRSNCDAVLLGAPKWPFTWDDGVHFSMMRPSTSGEITCYLAEPGKMPFERIVPRRAMVWMVADIA